MKRNSNSLIRESEASGPMPDERHTFWVSFGGQIFNRRRLSAELAFADRLQPACHRCLLRTFDESRKHRSRPWAVPVLCLSSTAEGFWC
jgi:hypothetical protein